MGQYGGIYRIYTNTKLQTIQLMISPTLYDASQCGGQRCLSAEIALSDGRGARSKRTSLSTLLPVRKPHCAPNGISASLRTGNTQAGS